MELRQHCARPDCYRLYAPSDSNQKHCSKYCSQLMQQRRRNNKRTERHATLVKELVRRYNAGGLSARSLAYEIRQIGDF